MVLYKFSAKSMRYSWMTKGQIISSRKLNELCKVLYKKTHFQRLECVIKQYSFIPVSACWDHNTDTTGGVMMTRTNQYIFIS